MLHGTVDELVATGRHSLRVRVDAIERAEQVLRTLPSVTTIERTPEGVLRLTLDRADDERAIGITRTLVEAGVGVAELAHERESLEERFLEITAGSSPGEMAEAS